MTQMDREASRAREAETDLAKCFCRINIAFSFCNKNYLVDIKKKIKGALFPLGKIRNL